MSFLECETNNRIFDSVVDLHYASFNTKNDNDVVTTHIKHNTVCTYYMILIYLKKELN
jgi:hypothetical protein